MIISFRHKGLEAFYATGSKRGIRADHADKLARVLSALDVAQTPADLAVPSFRTHVLKGNRDGEVSIWISGNWRITFRFVNLDVELIDYLDYH